MFVVPVLFLLGLVVGSFVNVLVFRFGFLESRRSRSACQACNAQLSWVDLIPVVSYLTLRGRCRHCESSISFQYPLVELGVGFLFVFSYLSAPVLFDHYALLGVVVTALFVTVFLFITVYDIHHTLIPTSAAWTLIVSATAFAAIQSFRFSSWLPLFDSILGALTLAFFIGIIVLLTRGRGMGAGDVYIAFAIGMFFGLVRGFEVLLMAFWSGALIGVLLIAFDRIFSRVQLPTPTDRTTATHTKRGFRMKSEVPFVPFLFFATLVGLFTHFSPLIWIQTFTTYGAL